MTSHPGQKWYKGPSPSFPAMFSKGGNFHDFLFANLEKEDPWRKEFAPMGEISFLYEVTLIYMGGNNENDRVISPENVHIYLNCEQIYQKMKAMRK